MIHQMYFAWLAFQALLAIVVPGPVGIGQLTPAGYQLKYKVNGMYTGAPRLCCVTRFIVVSFLGMSTSPVVFSICNYLTKSCGLNIVTPASAPNDKVSNIPYL